jgi:hypothetical protein
MRRIDRGRRVIKIFSLAAFFLRAFAPSRESSIRLQHMLRFQIVSREGAKARRREDETLASPMVIAKAL